ncbi:MAG TPA: fibronectin type III domain-containing protein [Chthoniobacterales bacterium]|nr:fibronectin type III domain-containing protein [Chthoniobacterales bacterium]
MIDAIPTEPASDEPNQPVISVSTSPGAGKAHLEFDSAHATSFDVLQKAPGATDFTKVVDDGLLKTYDATGLTAGSYQYQVVGRNSLGDSPASDPATITVA